MRMRSLEFLVITSMKLSTEVGEDGSMRYVCRKASCLSWFLPPPERGLMALSGPVILINTERIFKIC